MQCLVFVSVCNQTMASPHCQGLFQGHPRLQCNGELLIASRFQTSPLRTSCRQSPAERVKAKLKLMLERSTSGAVYVSQQRAKFTHSPFTGLVKQTQATPTAPPTDSQLASIEGEGFAAESFISHRTAGKQVSSSIVSSETF